MLKLQKQTGRVPQIALVPFMGNVVILDMFELQHLARLEAPPPPFFLFFVFEKKKTESEMLNVSSRDHPSTCSPNKDPLSHIYFQFLFVSL